MSYWILSLDGGGVRAALAAKLLERLEAKCPFLGAIELFAGTSTGAILAAGLAHGRSPTELVDFQRASAPRIFANRDALDAVVGSSDELFRADYDNLKGLRTVLREQFADARLRDVERRVLIPTFDLAGEAENSLSGFKPRLLHNYSSPGKSGPGKSSPGNDGELLVVDALLRATAAPTYFPSYQGFVDGAVVANNPSMCALTEAVGTGTALEDVVLLSIGTGVNPERIEGARHDWGRTQWFRRMIPLLFEAGPPLVDRQCRHLLGERYFRLNLEFEEPIGLDAVERLDDLFEMGEAADLDQVEAWLRRHLDGDLSVAPEVH